MKPRIVLLCALFFVVCSVAFSDQGHQHPYDPNEKLGSVSFPTSCSPAVQKSFERGIALMHSFWYEEAEKQFADVAAKDPSCAMAYWGESMSLWHQLWERPDDATTKRAAALVQQAEAAKPKTQRERDYISALAAFYKDGANVDFQVRATAYCNGMEKVYLAYPQDHEATAFYALSLLTSAPPRDPTFANEKKAIAILQKLFDEYPDHPGAAHYLIHATDSPQLAPLGLNAARVYARIAPASPHAVHMPSHIFARLGLWQEDIQSNLASIVATQRASEMHMGGSGHALHAMDFLEYAYLQIGDDAKAREIIDQTKTMHVDPSDGMYGYMEMASVTFPSTYWIETKNWKEAAAMQAPKGIKPYNEATVYWAHAVAYGHLGDAENARKAVSQYDAMVEATKKSSDAYIAEYMDTGADEARAWAVFAEGKNAEAVRLLRGVADRQDVIGKGETELPAREMLADMLMQMKRPADALAEYQKSLKVDPNRFNGLYGAAQAATAANEPDQAKTYYSQLLKNCAGSNSDRPELAQAKTLVAMK